MVVAVQLLHQITGHVIQMHMASNTSQCENAPQSEPECFFLLLFSFFLLSFLLRLSSSIFCDLTMFCV